MALTFVKLARPSPSSALGMEDNPMLLDQQEGMGKDLVVNPPQQTNDLHQSLLSRSPSKQQMERYLDGLYQNVNYLKEKLDNLPNKPSAGTASRGISSIDTARNSNTGVVTLTFNFDDNTSETDDFVVNDGRDGVGLRGLRGLAGTSVTITNSSTNAAGNIVVNFSDGSSIIVPSGDDGDDGDDGATWLTGTNVPGSALGNNGDFYFRTSNTTVYSKSNGAWGVVSSLAGADGATWHTGIIEPVSALGNNGDFYFKSDDASIWSKASGAWTQQIEIQEGTDGEDGATWISGFNAPSTNQGKVGDFYFRFSNGYVYEKVASNAWSFRRDITGPQGLKGNKGLAGTSVTVTSSTNAAGKIVVNFSDGSSISIPHGTDGDAGADGATWLTGVGVPANNLGVNGDFYFRTSNTTIYSKSGGAWSVLSSLAGADGATWHTGIIEPVSALGNNGDFYFKSDDASIWSKASGAWTQQIEIQQGTDGEDGDDGADGAIWRSGAGVPANDLGAQGDFYFQTSNGYVYEKTGAIVWTFQRDITGPQGLKGNKGLAGTSVTVTSSTNAAGKIVVNFSDGSSISIPHGTDGDAGADGATWHTGANVPGSALGNNGDFYFRTSNTTVYSKSGGAWSVLSSLAGADGATWHTGIIAPVSALGNNGDFYFKSDDASIWSKASGAWTQQIEIQQGTDGADGTVWHSGAGVPANNVGAQGDFYFQTSNGYVYEKTGAIVWSFRRDVTGPQGLRGLAGARGTSVTITSSSTNADGNTVVNFSDGSSIIVPSGDDGDDGDDGADGATWLTGVGVPANNLGNNGDFYLRTFNTTIYSKSNGAWSVLSSLAGADGATWHTGIIEPVSALGNNGDFYFKSDDASIWSKASGAWTQQIEIQQGTDGDDGEDGDDGADGTVWLNGYSPPRSNQGKVGDFYFRFANGFVYRKVASNAWSFQRDLTGPQGLRGLAGTSVTVQSVIANADGDIVLTFSDGAIATIPKGTVGRGIKAITRDADTNTVTITFDDGSSAQEFTLADGVDGKTWFSGSGEPAAALGNNGDFYLRTSNKNVYKKVNGGWTVEANLSGTDGATWFNGSTAPLDASGVNGDFYFRTSNATIWSKVAGAWTQLINITGSVGLAGSTWLSGDGAPANALGEIGDWYFRTSNGYVYEKTAETVWTFRRDVTGPQGLKGNKGEKGIQGLRGIPGIPGEDATSVKWFPFTYGLPYDTRKTATPATSGGGHYQAIYPVSVWHSGADAPDSMLGNNDDKYFRTSDTFVWHKNDLGVWNAQTQISTLYIGGSWHAGTGLPANGLGIQGDWYLNLSDGKVYKKIESARWTFSADIDGDGPDFSWDTVTELKFSTRDDDGVDRRDIFTAESLQLHPKLIGIRRDAPNNDVHVVAFKTTSEWTLESANSVVSVEVERVSGSDKGTIAEIAPIVDADYDVHLVLPYVVDNISLYGVRYPGNFDAQVDSATATAMAALSDKKNDAWPATAIVYANAATPGDNVNGDKVTLYRGSVSQTRVWNIATETWAGFEGYIGGNLLVDGAIVANHLSANAVTTEKIKAGAVIVTSIGSNAVTGVKIKAGSVTGGKIGDGAVTKGKIGTGAITSAKILSGAVLAVKIKDGAVTADKISAVNISAITGNFRDLNVAGVLSASRISSDVQNFKSLYAPGSGGGIYVNNITKSIVLSDSIENYDELIITMAAEGSNWLVGSVSIPVSQIRSTYNGYDGISFTNDSSSHGMWFSIPDQNINWDLYFRIWPNSGSTLRFQSTGPFDSGILLSVNGLKQP